MTAHVQPSKRKWFQVTRPTACLPAGMHGQNVASGNGVTLSPLLPAAAITRLRIKAPVRVRCSVPVEARPRYGLSLSSSDGWPFSPPPQPGQRSWPASSKRFSNLRLTRSAPHSRPRSAFLSPFGARSPRDTRCQVRFPNPPPVLEPLLPSGTSRSLGLVALSPIPDVETCPCESPDLPSLPAAL